jgi:oxygen-dependent protoporphyrinogen oxidase
MAMSDTELVNTVTEALRPLLGLQGEAAQTWVQRWPLGMPQYGVNHLDWADKVEATVALTPGLFVTGAAYRGIGVPDCIRQARTAAESVVDFLATDGTHAETHSANLVAQTEV